MKDLEVPSFVEDEEDDAQATMMWDRDALDVSDLDLGLEPGPSSVKSRGVATGGLDEGELFGDLSDLASERRAASIPVEGRLVQTTRPPPPANANDAAPTSQGAGKGARSRPGRNLWGWAAVALALAGALASGAYVLTQ